jgi:hypothetical protein
MPIFAASRIKFKRAAKARKREERREEQNPELNFSRLPSLISRDFLFSEQDFFAQRRRTAGKRKEKSKPRITQTDANQARISIEESGDNPWPHSCAFVTFVASALLCVSASLRDSGSSG